MATPTPPERDNFTYLTVALVLLLFITALFDQLEIALGQLVVQASIIMVIAVGTWSVSSGRRWFHTGIGFVIAIGLLSAAGMSLDMVGLNILWLAVVLAFLVTTTWLAIQQVLFTGSVNINKIIGSICIFLLLGLIWTILYMMIAEVTPDALKGLDSATWYETFPDYLYFSFVTLTTLGYGDISPLTPLAGFLALMEAIVGQFYIAIVVASLVGTRISSRSDQETCE